MAGMVGKIFDWHHAAAGDRCYFFFDERRVFSGRTRGFDNHLVNWILSSEFFLSLEAVFFNLFTFDSIRERASLSVIGSAFFGDRDLVSF